MSRFDGQVKRIVQTLRLKSMPIGAKFSETPDRRGIDRQLRICEALDVVRRKKSNSQPFKRELCLPWWQSHCGLDNLE
jgi:uncharacterized protein (DUF169 family)